MISYFRLLEYSMGWGMSPNAGRMKRESKHGPAMFVVAVLTTLVVLSVLAIINPKVMFATAGVAFLVLGVRFVRLVRRELQ